jgi:hypothetical protein
VKGPLPTTEDGKKIDQITRDLADQLYDRIKRLGYCVPPAREHEVYELAAILLGRRFRGSPHDEWDASKWDDVFKVKVENLPHPRAPAVAAKHDRRVSVHREPFWLRLTFDTDKVKRKSKRLIGHRRPLRRKERDWHNFAPDIAARFRSIVMEPDLGDRDGPVADFVVEAIALGLPDQEAPTADAVGQYLYRRRKKEETRACR